MTWPQRGLVAEAVRTYKSIRADLARAAPFWPLGLPQWSDPSLALGMRSPGATYITAWHRAPAGSVQGQNPAVIVLPISHLRGVTATPEVLYPLRGGASARWDAVDGMLAVSLPRTPSACLIQLRAGR